MRVGGRRLMPKSDQCLGQILSDELGGNTFRNCEIPSRSRAVNGSAGNQPSAECPHDGNSQPVASDETACCVEGKG